MVRHFLVSPMAFNIADIFERAVDLLPERMALVAAATHRTYAELDERANRVAHHLAERASAPASTSASTPRTAPSGSRRCSAASSCGPSRST